MLREKDLSTQRLVELGGDVAVAARKGGALFLVNGDVDAAAALGADGVHLGYGAPPVHRARTLLGPEARIGVSTHDLEELRAASASGADYVTFGPVFDTPSKRGLLEPRGIAATAAAVEAAPGVPVIALGGIHHERPLHALRTVGVAGVAAIRALLDTDDAEQAARALVASWNTGAAR
jgi:thiamine-phosphate pyrophosphorylase